MASLRSITQREAEVIREGIAWVIVYKDGKSWESMELWSDVWNGILDMSERETIEEILEVDENAVALNGYYCGRLGENVRELEMGIRWHYENDCNLLKNYMMNTSVIAE